MGPPGSGKTQVLLHRARWLSRSLNVSANRFTVLVYINVLTYFFQQAIDFLGIPTGNVRTFDDLCAELWDAHLHTAAVDGDPFVKSNQRVGHKSLTPPATDNNSDDDVGFL
jgi:superfamily I DNA/RNA helicase